MTRIKAEKLVGKELTAYIDWLETPSKQHTVGIGNGPVKTKAVPLYVYPFNVAMPTGTIAKASASTAASTALLGKVSAHTYNSITAGTFALGIYKFSAARIVHKTGIVAKATEKTSHITTRQYGSKGGTSLSIPFGRSSATADETEVDVFEVVKTAFGTNGVLQATESVTLVKEKFSSLSE